MSLEAHFKTINTALRQCVYTFHSVLLTGQVTLCPTTKYPPSGKNTQLTSFSLFLGDITLRWTRLDRLASRNTIMLFFSFHINLTSFLTLSSSVTQLLQWVCLHIHHYLLIVPSFSTQKVMLFTTGKHTETQSSNLLEF